MSPINLIIIGISQTPKDVDVNWIIEKTIKKFVKYRNGSISLIDISAFQL